MPKKERVTRKKLRAAIDCIDMAITSVSRALVEFERLMMVEGAVDVVDNADNIGKSFLRVRDRLKTLYDEHEDAEAGNSWRMCEIKHGNNPTPG